MIETGRRAVEGALRLAASFARQTNGVAAVEFALILPILAVLFLGSVELTNALTANRKVSQVANTIGDLVSQYRNLDEKTLKYIFEASAAIMTPYSNSDLIISVAGIEVDEDGKLDVKWSRQWSKDAPDGSAPDLVNEVPEALKTPNSFLIVAKTEYDYKALFVRFSSSTFKRSEFALSDVFFLRPRIGKEVKYIP